MKRELEGGGKIKSPRSQRGIERKFESLLNFMVREMGERIENGALKKLNKGTIEKFADGQSGNYANIFLGLTKDVRRSLMKQFDDDRLEQFVDEILLKADAANADLIYSQVEKKIGIPQAQLIGQEGLNSQLTALRAETLQWVFQTRDETMAYFVNNALRAMSGGDTISGIVEKHHENVKNRKGHAKFVARQQLATYNSLATKLRAQNLGIEKAIWVTANDGDRVRASHQDRHGKEFDLSQGLYSSVDQKTILPAMDYGCRCGYDLVIPDVD